MCVHGRVYGEKARKYEGERTEQETATTDSRYLQIPTDTYIDRDRHRCRCHNSDTMESNRSLLRRCRESGEWVKGPILVSCSTSSFGSTWFEKHGYVMANVFLTRR